MHVCNRATPVAKVVVKRGPESVLGQSRHARKSHTPFQQLVAAVLPKPCGMDKHPVAMLLCVADLPATQQPAAIIAICASETNGDLQKGAAMTAPFGMSTPHRIIHTFSSHPPHVVQHATKYKVTQCLGTAGWQRNPDQVRKHCKSCTTAPASPHHLLMHCFNTAQLLHPAAK